MKYILAPLILALAVFYPAITVSGQTPVEPKRASPGEVNSPLPQRPTATIKAPSKAVRALIVDEVLAGKWRLSSSDEFTILFTRFRSPPSGQLAFTPLDKIVIERLAHFMLETKIDALSELAQFTIIEVGSTTKVRVETGYVVGGRFNAVPFLHPTSNPGFNIEMEKFLDQVKVAAEKAPRS